MPTLEISGILVEFPFDPYDSQLIYMEKVIYSLQHKQNALLESPTGTGKTLCLLCATLAWRNAEILKKSKNARINIEYDHAKKPKNTQFGQNSTEDKLTIIYASRTHSQLKQVVKELKNTKYSPKICVLGSREQLCVHKDISKHKGTVQNYMCRKATKSKTCEYKNGYDAMSTRRKQTMPIMDIEELVETLRDDKICPFFLSRDLKNDSDIIFLPYNYLVDVSVRNSLGVSIENSILIFDEAHNVENVATEAASFELTSNDLAGCVKEVEKCLSIVLKYASGVGDGSMVSPDSLATLKALFSEIEKGLYNYRIPDSTTGLTKPGEEIFEFFKKFNITFTTCDLVIQILEDTIQFLSSLAGKTPQSPRLDHILDCLKRIFRDKDNHLKTSRMYRVHICETEERTRGSNRSSSVFAPLQSTRKIRVLSYWCFFPGVAMQEIVSNNVHNIILTSGTLSPLDLTAKELGLEFSVRLENSHVIDADQVWVGIIKSGVTGKRLNSSYRFRDSSDYIMELGNTIVNFSRVVPKGLLVFFPSYSNLEECIKRWKIPTNQSKTTWDRICSFKSPFVEPRGNQDFKAVVDEYSNCIKMTDNGGVFFAVCRGKVSEGIDFSDDNGRAVIITGLPFAPTKDPKIVLKRNYLDNQPAIPGIDKLSGNYWYVQQASRAVNQAIGRVIRHRHDFGAVILCDERFALQQQRSGLSKWLHPFVQNCKSYGEGNLGLIKFFKKTVVRQLKEKKDRIYDCEPEKKKYSAFKPPQKLVSTNNTKVEKPIMSETLLGDILASSNMTSGQTYINPSLFKQIAKESTDTSNISRSDREFSTGFRATEKEKTKPPSLDNVFSNSDSSMSSTTSSILRPRLTNKMDSTPLSKKYFPMETSGREKSELSRKKRRFGLGSSLPRFEGQVTQNSSIKEVSTVLALSRQLLSSTEVTTLFQLIKKSQLSSDPKLALNEICVLLKPTSRHQILLELKSFFTTEQVSMFEECLKKLSITLPNVSNKPPIDITHFMQRVEHVTKKRNAVKHQYAASVKNPQCLVCYEISSNSFASPCGHICCLACWKKMKKKSVSNCPVCKCDFDFQALQPLKSISSKPKYEK